MVCSWLSLVAYCDSLQTDSVCRESLRSWWYSPVGQNIILLTCEPDGWAPYSQRPPLYPILCHLCLIKTWTISFDIHLILFPQLCPGRNVGISLWDFSSKTMHAFVIWSAMCGTFKWGGYGIATGIRNGCLMMYTCTEKEVGYLQADGKDASERAGPAVLVAH